MVYPFFVAGKALASRDASPLESITPSPATNRVLRAAIVAGLVASFATLIGPAVAFAVTEHTVEPGETLSTIADRYGLPVETLMDVNGISDPDSVMAGQVLRIPDFAVDIGGDAARGPAETTSVSEPASDPAPAILMDSGLRHFILAGEWLSTIAPMYGVALEALMRANNITNADFIVAGTTLIIPGGGGRNRSHSGTDDARRQHCTRRVHWRVAFRRLPPTTAYRWRGWPTPTTSPTTTSSCSARAC